MSASETDDTAGKTGVTVCMAEIVVSLLTSIIGIVIIYGSFELGIGWTSVGPAGGYFPFYIGLIMLLSSLGTLGFALFKRSGKIFSTGEEFMRMLGVFSPMCLYGILMPFIGMYISSGLFIAWFMWREKKIDNNGNIKRTYAIWKVAAMGIGVPVAVYFIFEYWFQINLYAGPFFK